MSLDTPSYCENIDPSQELSGLLSDIECGLEQPAPFTAGYQFEVTGGNENLRDPSTRQIQRQSAEGDIFNVIQTLPARGHYQYVLVEDENGQQFSLCINDTLQQNRVISSTETTLPQPETTETFQGLLYVQTQENLRDPESHQVIRIAQAGESFPILDPNYEDRGAYTYALVMVDQTPCKICTNDGDSVLVAPEEDPNQLLTPPAQEDAEPDLEEAEEFLTPNSLSENQSRALSISYENLPETAQQAFLALQAQIEAVDQSSTRGPSPVHLESGNTVQLDYGNRIGWDVDLSADNWTSLSEDEQVVVVEALNLWWNANYAESSDNERTHSYLTQDIVERYQRLEDNLAENGPALVQEIVDFCEVSPGREAAAFLAECYQRLVADGHQTLAQALADQIVLNQHLINNPAYEDFCAAVQNTPEPQQEAMQAVHSINLSLLGTPTMVRPFRLIQQGDQLVVAYNEEPLSPQPEGEFNVSEQAFIIKELNDKVEPLFGRYDSSFESFGKGVLDMFGDYRANNTTNAVLARLRDEPEFLNSLPEDRQDEAACAAFMTRYLENLYGQDFSSFSGIGGRNAWEYASALEDSGYGIISADLSDSYTIDPVRAQNERDKDAILLEDLDGTLQAQIEGYVEAAFDPDASGGIATFHYRLTAANDDIVNTPHASPNSHVTNILGPRQYTVPSQGGGVAQSLIRHFNANIRIHENGHPEYLQYLRNVQCGETALSYDPQQQDFIDANGEIYRPQSGESITFQDVELAHFYHKHPGDTDPIRRDGMVALMVSGLFEPVQIIEMNPRAVTTPDLNQNFNPDFIIGVQHRNETLSLNEIRDIYRSEYGQIEPRLPENTVSELTNRSIEYLTGEIYASIFRGSDTNQNIFPANSPIPIIDWRESPIIS